MTKEVTATEALEVARVAWPCHAACHLVAHRVRGVWEIEDKTCHKTLTLHDDYVRVARGAK